MWMDSELKKDRENLPVMTGNKGEKGKE